MEIAEQDIITDEQADAILAQEKVDHLNTKKVNQAAYDFMNLTKNIKYGINTLSLNQCKRLILTMVEYPFIKTDRKLSKIEQQLFMQIITAQQNNSIMREALALSKEEVESKVVDPIKDEIVKNEG